ncbi:hypothetical protein N7510_000271 [Penicillium lagena]|uniref:uncharacterized protein n=1 Tax=Penicillium lagena TaxID=94218 RepID=UPI00253FDB3B|nr:uncharacterized protein N7510_000271 [Penicillium lagena]KAJ5623962.1 hypothetical protein N7510_000271 [Penicillium lagena]
MNASRVEGITIGREDQAPVPTVASSYDRTWWVVVVVPDTDAEISQGEASHADQHLQARLRGKHTHTYTNTRERVNDRTTTTKEREISVQQNRTSERKKKRGEGVGKGNKSGELSPRLQMGNGVDGRKAVATWVSLTEPIHALREATPRMGRRDRNPVHGRPGPVPEWPIPCEARLLDSVYARGPGKRAWHLQARAGSGDTRKRVARQDVTASIAGALLFQSVRGGSGGTRTRDRRKTAVYLPPQVWPLIHQRYDEQMEGELEGCPQSSPVEAQDWFCMLDTGIVLDPSYTSTHEEGDGRFPINEIIISIVIIIDGHWMYTNESPALWQGTCGQSLPATEQECSR